jgi:NADH-quinone oxidoreductase subunit L
MAPVLGHPETHGGLAEEYAVMGISVLIAFAGLFLARYFYLVRKDIPVALSRRFSLPYRVLWNKYYIDEIYDFLIIRPTMWVARSVIVGITDGKIIEGVVNGLPRTIGRTGQALRKVHNGLVHNYAAIMGLGFLAVLAIAFMW